MFRPDALDLIECAREAFAADLLPTVPEDQRYLALMVANALAIAARELRGYAQLADGRAVLERSAALLHDARLPIGWEEAERALASLIRQKPAGPAALDPAELHEVLVGLTRTRLAIDHPRALSAYPDCGAGSAASPRTSTP